MSGRRHDQQRTRRLERLQVTPHPNGSVAPAALSDFSPPISRPPQSILVSPDTTNPRGNQP